MNTSVLRKSAQLLMQRSRYTFARNRGSNRFLSHLATGGSVYAVPAVTEFRSNRKDHRIFKPFHQSSVRVFSSLPEHKVEAMPALSPTMESGTIVKWNLKEGDAFSPGTGIAEVATDKATITFEATDDGVVAKFLCEEGASDIAVGSPIMVTVEDAADVAAFANFTVDTSSPSAAPAPVAEAPAATAGASAAVPVSAVSAAVTAESTPHGRAVASPLARKLWRENAALAQHPLSLVKGTGPGGRILAADVVGFKVPEASAPSHSVTTAAPEPAVVEADGEDWYSRQYALSKRTIPHYSLTMDVDMSAAIEMRAQLNRASGGATTESLSVADFVIKATAQAMKQVPAMNASWQDSSVREYHEAHVNVMLGLGEQIQAPVVKNVHSLGLKDIAREMNEFEEKFLSDDSTGSTEIEVGTFTIHNLGMYGVRAVSPVIMPGQAGALGVGAIVDTVVPNTDEDAEQNYRVIPQMSITLACDHRVVDGAVGATFLQHVKNYLQNPINMLL